MKLLITVLVLITIFPQISFSKIQTFKLKDRSIQFDLPGSWRSEKDLFGLPLVLLGPYGDGSRVTISISDSGVDGLTFDEDGMDDSQIVYQKGRKKWLKQLGLKLIKFIPYHVETWNHVDNVQSTGLAYKAINLDFHEFTHYLNCNGRLYHLKALLREDLYQKEMSLTRQVLTSFKCL